MLLWVIPPYTVFLNVLVFGKCIFNSAGLFSRALLYSGIYLLLVYFVFGLAASLVQKRFPGAGDMFKRIAIMLPVFYIMNGISGSGIFYVYNQWPLLPCPARPGMLVWTIVYGCIMSTIITFINEGVVNWEAWKASITETERLKNVYQRSKVLGLKGQINPHFLFNCFNTLSGLIQEDTAKAEMFLDEMTKVHRYLLRSGDELLVPLDSELKFAGSYLYLARERFGDSIRYSVDIGKEALEKKLPPLSLQVILENIIYSNAMSKSDPLTIRITSADAGSLSVVHSVHEKRMQQTEQADAGLDNLVSKYEMLHTGAVRIGEHGKERTIRLPLFDNKPEII